MRAARLLALCAALAAGGVAASAAAQPGEPAAQVDKAQKTPAADGKSDQWGDGRAHHDPRKEPARGEPYAWRQMAFGVAIMAGMLGFLVWLIRRQTRAR